MARLPPLNALRAFEAAARHLSFRHAADEIGVSPSAISHQIRLLESLCGQALFRRRPRPLALTAAGQRLYPVLQAGFRSFADVFDELNGQIRARPLRVTTTSSFAARWLVPRLPDWRRHDPGFALEIIGSDRIMDLAADEADIAIRYARAAPSHPSATLLLQDRYGPVCRPDLLPRGRAVTQATDLLGLPLIHYDWQRADPGNAVWSTWWRAAAAHESLSPAAPPLSLTFREELHAIEAVLGGEGVGILSDVVVGRELSSGSLVRAHSLTIPGMNYWLVARADHPRRKAIATFCDWIRALAASADAAPTTASAR